MPRTLARLEGVHVESTSIRKGEVVLHVKDPAFRLDPALLRTMVREGGATLRRIRLEGTGTLEAGAWVVEASGQRFPVAGAAAPGRLVVSGTMDIPREPEAIPGVVDLSGR